MRFCVCMVKGKEVSTHQGNGPCETEVCAYVCASDPNSHRMHQRITHRFYDILHQAPAHVWGWNPSAIIVAHMHSV